jgi:transcriptional regulator NrdR family protein
LETQAQTAIVCPECGSDKAFKNGTRELPNGEIKQRYMCRQCMHRYTFPPALKVKDNVVNDNQIGAFKVKNLVLTTQNIVVGDNAKINDFLEWMKQQGYKNHQ